MLAPNARKTLMVNGIIPDTEYLTLGHWVEAIDTKDDQGQVYVCL